MLLAPSPPAYVQVRVADYLVPAPGAWKRKIFRVTALRWAGGRLEETEFANIQEVASAPGLAALTRWRLSAGTSTESYAVLPGGAVRLTEIRSWQKEPICREYPALLDGGGWFREWGADPGRGRDVRVRVAGRESVRAAGRAFETVVFEAEDGLFKFRTWLAKDLGEIRSEVRSGPVVVSRRLLVGIER